MHHIWAESGAFSRGMNKDVKMSKLKFLSTVTGFWRRQDNAILSGKNNNGHYEQQRKPLSEFDQKMKFLSSY
jgi:hypothetical protein